VLGKPITNIEIFTGVGNIRSLENLDDCKWLELDGNRSCFLKITFGSNPPFINNIELKFMPNEKRKLVT
jgi:hypothetical protein